MRTAMNIKKSLTRNNKPTIPLFTTSGGRKGIERSFCVTESTFTKICNFIGLFCEKFTIICYNEEFSFNGICDKLYINLLKVQHLI